MGRVYQTCSNQDHVLSFEYIMKMGEQNGMKINEKMAKGMVRMYGGEKGHMSLEDCMKINQRKRSKMSPPQRGHRRA